MDKIIEKKTGWRVAFTKKALPWWLGALLLAFVIYLIARPNNKTLRVDKDTVTISSAVKGEFNDYIRISGRVQPMTTIQPMPASRTACPASASLMESTFRSGMPYAPATSSRYIRPDLSLAR